ncbi:hypothetical protein JCM19037_2608 [Geomicrobium sp. JCM 19037]|nr:hypothetical protein JCM19037_2608 [Geomicrobium sp. JCM 19037]
MDLHNQQPMNQQNQTMSQPPAMISTKDQLYLSDMLNWNLTAAKKARFYAQHAMDPKIKETLDQVAGMHEKHYQRLLPHLNSQGGTQ